MSLGIGDAHPVGSSCSLLSYPYLYGHVPSGWIHTSYDNSTSTGTLNWIEVDDLEAHVKVATLTVMRVSPSGDLNGDGTIDIRDITIVALAFGTRPGDDNRNAIADLNNDDVIDIRDITIVALEFGKST